MLNKYFHCLPEINANRRKQKHSYPKTCVVAQAHPIDCSFGGGERSLDRPSQEVPSAPARSSSLWSSIFQAQIQSYGCILNSAIKIVLPDLPKASDAAQGAQGPLMSLPGIHVHDLYNTWVMKHFLGLFLLREVRGAGSLKGLEILLPFI